eukprot:TRINITY_DN120391_c0_g1_i1.p1 TRINITY_DN120391_c0_g1~~TRINITY_DN120391_c0_g1_i1.p1  ORF type:complete len:1062 (+),score=118.32 TRINITY_DN120391_c0_g1_i1:93-3278(+)
MQPHEHSHGHHHHEHTHDKRFHEFINALRSGSAKQTLKQIRKVLKKGVPSPVDMLLFRITEAMALHQLGENSQAEKCLKEISVDLLKFAELDEHVITMFLYAAKSQGLSTLSMDTLEKLYKAHPKDSEFAEKLFSECIGSNKFFRMNILAKDLESRTKKDEYTLASIYSLYMFAKYEADRNSPSAKGYIKLANIELTKYLATHKISLDQLPPNLYDLYRQILLFSDSHSEALKLATTQKTLSPEKKAENEYTELKELKQYPEAINVLLQEVFGNLQKGQKAEYMHETYQRMAVLLLAYYFSTVKDPKEIAKIGLSELWDNRDKAEGTLDVPKITIPENTLKKLCEVFAILAGKGKIGEVSFGLNEIRGAYLIMLLILHKFMLFAMKHGLSEKVKEISETISKVAQEYAKRFASTASVYTDLIAYCTDLTLGQRVEVIKAVKAASDALDKPEADYTKYLTSRILYYKLKASLSPTSDVRPLLEEICRLYKSAKAKLDKKLEKGERHPADDLILVADYILGTYSDDAEKSGVLTPCTTLRILLLNQGLKDSPFNFDFKVKLLVILMRHNLNYMTRSIYDSLRIKGVLTETLGYFYEKYLIEHIHTDKLAEVIKKFEKFTSRNTEELEGVKVKAVKESNFHQAEEFCKYGLQHVYSQHRIVLNTAVTLFEYMQNAQAKGQSIVLGVTPKITEQVGLLKNKEKLTKNQDVYTLQDRIRQIPLITQYENEIKVGFSMALESSWNDLILDSVLLPHMPVGKTNYREGMSNLFGILELPQLNILLHTLCMIVGYFYEKNFTTTFQADIENFDTLFKDFEAAAKSASKSAVFTEYAEELEDMIQIFGYVNEMLKAVLLLHETSTTKDPTVISKNIEAILKVLASAKEYIGRVLTTAKSVLAKKPQDPSLKWTLVTEAHPLLAKPAMRRFMGIMQYLGVCSHLVFSVVKIAFPEGISKKPKKGEAPGQGEVLKKALLQLKRDVTNAFNEALVQCQGIKLSEGVNKWVSEWEALPEGLMKVPLLMELVNSENAKEVTKKVKEEMVSAVEHVEVVFRPIVKALSAIDIQTTQ